MLSEQLDKASLSLNYQFQDKKLLEMALLHPSLKKKRRSFDFERLEFLGDRILGLVIAEQLFIYFGQESEGDLAKRLAVLVSRDACLAVARTLKFDEIYDALGAEEGAKSTILADAMEAVIGAVYLDGGLDAAKTVIHKLWQPKIKSTKKPPKDHKSALQEWSQKLGYGVPEYTVIEMSGPAHAPHFVMQVKVQNLEAQATGASKRVAEQEAAKILLEKVSK
ncbi:ribonuclease III [Candidatus Paracaedibacter symbiosus]|uniref:ribonuclease III n=1 Tax=Candidatus Paracaedibacter symbiosus TaxID=244582 RepID=UPI00069118C1|nr:ribonuclease III [Candidatus Paracaedibacter symbiosus]